MASSRKVYDLVATIGKYTDHHGEEKKRYHNCGSVFEDDQGRLSIKVEAIPVGPEWSGWMSCMVPKARQQQQPAPQQQQAAPAQQQPYQSPQQPAQGTAFQGYQDEPNPFT